MRSRNRKVFQRLRVPLVGVIVLCALTPAFAAVPIEERSSSTAIAPKPRLEPAPPARDYRPETPQPQPQDTAPSTPSGLAQLFAELQTLRGEVQVLRSQVEEQQHQIRKLEAAQLEQYRNLDERVLALGRPGPATTAPKPAPASASAGTQTATTPSATGVNPPPAGKPAASKPVADSENALYAEAFSAATSREFEKSITLFRRVVDEYPNGQKTPPSLYWLGELYLAESKMDLASQSFMRVIDEYPAHAKAPDAMYKMGVLHQRLGDNARALEFLDRVQREHPDSAAAGLAKTYASELR
ncbi:MAG: tol-pal system protein YbgF [Pseudomonadales bacterium]